MAGGADGDLIGALRAQARALFDAGLAAADPARAVSQALDAAPLGAPGPDGAWHVIAFGKAARAMAGAALAQMGPLAVPALVVTNYENDGPLPGAEVMAAGHPVPDAAGARAAQAVLDRARGLGPHDRLLALVSGGASALLPAPAAGLTLDDKAQVSRLLLACGADITQMNLIRQSLSRIKGGGLLRAAAPAPLVGLILSDVIGDDLRVVASGPTVEPLGSRAEAAALLRRLGLWAQVPEAVRARLGAPATPRPPHPRPDNRLVGSNARSVAAMAQAARAFGRAPVLAPAPLAGDVAEAAARVCAAGAAGPGLYLFGGETTVTLRGPGTGGRNQELALRLALAAEAAGWAGDWVFLSGGTDGRDGPTDAAGGLVDGGTLSRMRAAGLSPEAALAANDSNPALAVAGDLLVTGATGTNVADLQVLIRA
jgi:hydroxypyruvate reductase